MDALCCKKTIVEGDWKIMKEKMNVTGVPETMVQNICMQEQKKQKSKIYVKIKDEITQ